jgi:hypothetical protein
MADSQQFPRASPQDTSERSPSWRQLYLNAQREKGIDRIKTAVLAAEAAIFERCQEIGDLPDHTEERRQLAEATDELLIIKTQKLNWPVPSA